MIFKNILSVNKNKSGFYFLCIGLTFWFLLNFLYGERVFVNNGLGWDGLNYASMVDLFAQSKWFGEYNLYYTQRIFPSFVIFMLSKLFGFSPTDPQNIINAFYIYNTFLLLISMYIFYRIAKMYNWSFPIFLIGFSGLFLNFFILKNTPFYPVLTDCTAFTIGMMMLYFYLCNRLVGLISITFIGAFTFPTLAYAGCLLLLFPHNRQEKNHKKVITLKIENPMLTYWLPVCFSLLITIISVMAYFSHYSDLTQPYSIQVIKERFFWRWIPMLILGITGTFIYSVMMIKPFIQSTVSFKINLYRFLLFFFLIIVIKLTIALISNKITGAFTTFQYFKAVFACSIKYPLLSLPSHFTFFGPIVLLIIFYWNKMVALASKHPSLILFLLMYAILLYGPESRCYNNAMPVLVFLLCEVLMTIKERITIQFSYGIIILSLVISKFWLPINKLLLDPIFFKPYQVYSLNFGPWMSPRMYIVQTVIMISLLFYLWIYKKNHLDLNTQKTLGPIANPVHEF